VNRKRDFKVVWIGQTIATFGSQMTTFAMSVWLFDQTQSLLQFGLMVALQLLPTVLLSPFAGVLVDRFDRRRLMLLADMSQAVLLSIAYALLVAGRFGIAEVYTFACLSAVLSTLQQLSYSTLIPRMVPESDLGKANGMLQITHYSGALFAPLLGVVLMQSIQLQGVVLINAFTFAASVLTLLMVGKRLLATATAAPEVHRAGSWREEMLLGWRYVRANPGLYTLMRFMALCCFAVGCIQVLFRPLILTLATPETLAFNLTLAGAGGLIGGLFVAITGGPSNRVRGVLLFMAALGVAVMAHSAVVSIYLIGLGSFVFAFCFPVIGACVQSVWQQRVPHEIQGRVFAFRRMVTSAALPIGVLVSPLFVDHVSKSLVASDGVLSRLTGVDFGAVPGAEIALPFLLMGAVILSISLLSLFDKRLSALAADSRTPSKPLNQPAEATE
jgi:DHA3 family macrolide efflux protein-like MFS transporter